MFKKYMMTLIVVLGLGSVTCMHGKKDALAGLDTFSQNPYEIMMQQMKDELKKKFTPIIEKILELEHLLTALNEEEMKLLLAVFLGEKQLEEIFSNPNYKKQEVIFMKLTQEFEKKGMTEENSLAFAKRAEKECPLAFQAAALMMEIAPLKETLSLLLMEVLFKSLEKFDSQNSAK